MADLRALRRSLTRAESLSTLEASRSIRPASAKPAARPQHKGAAPWLMAPPPRADDGVALSRWVERRLAPFASSGADEPDGICHAATDWGDDEVQTWLRCSVGLEELGPTFSAHGVTGVALLTLSETDLLAMGVRWLGHRKRVLTAAAELRQQLPSLPAALAEGTGAARRQWVDKQRRHVGALGECMQKVMTHCPELPLQSRQMLLGLWQAQQAISCLLYTSPSPRDRQKSRMPSSA